MVKFNKQSIITTTIVFLLICFAVFLRNVYRITGLNNSVLLLSGVLRGFIYMGLFAVWGYFLHRRIIQTQVRHFFVLIAILMVFWIAVRTVKFNMFNQTFLGRELWYLYYLPMLFIPLLSFFIALSLGKSEKYKLPNWTNLFFYVSIFLFLLVITNDFHQLVFGFPNGLMHFENGEYTHKFAYYIIMGWIAVCSVSTLGVIIKKSRVPYSKQFVIFPLVPFF